MQSNNFLFPSLFSLSLAPCLALSQPNMLLIVLLSSKRHVEKYEGKKTHSLKELKKLNIVRRREKSSSGPRLFQWVSLSSCHGGTYILIAGQIIRIPVVLSINRLIFDKGASRTPPDIYIHLEREKNAEIHAQQSK